MSFEIAELTSAEIESRVKDGSFASYSEEGLPAYIDCGDKRPLTAECLAKRSDISARYFGGGCGLALVAMNSVGMQSDTPYRASSELLDEYEDGLVGLAADISDRSYEKYGTRVYLHSADNVEGHPRSIKDNCADDVGCALMAKSGIVISNAASTATFSSAREVGEYDGSSLDENLEEASINANIMLAALGGEDFKIQRTRLLSVLRKPLKTPFAMLKGEPHIDDSTGTFIDLKGYKIAADNKNYAHSVPLAEEILPSVLPGLDLDPRALKASSLLLAVATHQTLGVKTAKVIPAG